MSLLDHGVEKGKSTQSEVHNDKETLTSPIIT